MSLLFPTTPVFRWANAEPVNLALLAVFLGTGTYRYLAAVF
jgi:hypothetical protein